MNKPPKKQPPTTDMAEGSLEETRLERTNEQAQVEGRCMCLHGWPTGEDNSESTVVDSVECTGSKKEVIIAHQTPSGCISSQPPPTNVDNELLAGAQKELCAQIRLHHLLRVSL